MAYKSIIFDLDGTLIDSAQLTGQIIDQMLAERGVTGAADRDLIRAMDAVGGEAMIATVMGEHTADPRADLDEFRARHRTLATPPDIAFSGVADTLQQLTGMGIALAICSNKPQFLCEKILADLRLDHCFAAIVGSDPARPRKPHPAAALQALAAVGSDASGTLYCGDSDVDVKTAKAANLDACLVGWGYGTKAARELAPDLPVLGSMAELITLMQGSDCLDAVSGGRNPG